MSLITLSHRSTFSDRLAAAFRAVGDFLVLLAEAGPRSEALRRLTRLTDEDLAARGTTRDAEIRRILGVRAQL